MIINTVIAITTTAPTAPPIAAPTFDSCGSSGWGVPAQATVSQSGAVVQKKKNGAFIGLN